MPVPALIGLASLGSLFGTVLAKVVEFFFSKTAKRIGVMTLVIAAAYAAIQLVLGLVSLYAAPLIASLSFDIVGTAQMLLPSNTTACVSAVIATEIGCITYSVTIKALEYQSRIV